MICFYNVNLSALFSNESILSGVNVEAVLSIYGELSVYGDI